MGAAGFEQRVRDLVLDLPFVGAVVLALLEVRSALRRQLAKLHKMLLDEVCADPICRRLMTAPGVGPVVALIYRTCVDTSFIRGESHIPPTSRTYRSGG